MSAVAQTAGAVVGGVVGLGLSSLEVRGKPMWSPGYRVGFTLMGALIGLFIAQAPSPQSITT